MAWLSALRISDKIAPMNTIAITRPCGTPFWFPSRIKKFGRYAIAVTTQNGNRLRDSTEKVRFKI